MTYLEPRLRRFSCLACKWRYTREVPLSPLASRVRWQVQFSASYFANTTVCSIYIILFHCVKYPLGACGIGGRMSRNAVHKSLKGMEAPAGSVPRELIGASGLPPAGAYNSRRRRGVAVFLSIKTLPPLPSRFSAKNVEVCEPVYYVHQSTTAAITARRPNLWPPQFTNQPSTLV